MKRASDRKQLLVLSERCDQCLYSPNKIVSNDRRKEILREIEAQDDYFICHKASQEGRVVACRGDYDQRGCGMIGRLAQALNLVVFLDEDALTGD